MNIIFRLQWPLIALMGFLLYLTQAQTVQNSWLAPALPDLSTTITLGKSYNIQWTDQLQGAFALYAPSANVSDVALWIAPNGSSVGQRQIAAGVYVATTTNYTWTIDLTANDLTSTGTDWFFVFLTTGKSYILGQQNISSPQVLMQNAVPSSASTSSVASSSASSTASTISASVATTSSSSSSSTATSAPASTPSSSSLSGGAVAGIVIGTVAVILSLAALLILLLRKKRSTQMQNSAPYGRAAGNQYAMDHYKDNPPARQSYGSNPMPASGQYMGRSELHANATQSYGGTQMPAYEQYMGRNELDANAIR